jgi:hypothetical protein
MLTAFTEDMVTSFYLRRADCPTAVGVFCMLCETKLRNFRTLLPGVSESVVDEVGKW